MTSDVRIIKIGGSVLTDKTKAGAICGPAVHRIAQDIAAAQSCAPLIIVHGAGSCGHPEAAAWHIQAGVTKENAPGIAKTHEAVSALNAGFVAALQSAGVPAVGFHPFEAALAGGGRLVFCGLEQIRALLSVGLVPVLHGDVVMDLERGACIVSGDQIVPFLAKALCAADVGIVTETGGVLADGAIVPKITRETVAALDFSTQSGGADVTGGMKGKIDELLLLADAGIPSHIFAPEYVTNYLEKIAYPGTTVQ
ncbi:MAG TPA: isopentenyl phosphate kinase [Methanocorpusculum sp.]|nr:isopentenyl phosphate kinase [Methanocorpusculum sp.]